MAGGYECLHVPLKGTVSLLRNPWALGAGAFFFLVVVKEVGIWPFVFIGAFMVAAFIFIIYLQMKGTPQNSLKTRTVRMEPSNVPWCIGNHGVRATTVFKVITSSGVQEIPVCDAHIGQTEQWLVRQQLTRG